MSIEVWCCWPTVNMERSREMIKVWHERGYKVSVLINPPHEDTELAEAERVIVQNEWKGFPVAANVLCWETPGDIVVVVGDDIYPDKDHTPQEIAGDFQRHFPDFFGVMQPIGDEFGWTHKCAVSPWIGKMFIEKSYNGCGPFWEEYFHYFCDQELQEYATKLGVFYQRKDLTQYHDHWQRKEGGERPGYLLPAKKRWHKDKKIFDGRMAKGFPDGINKTRRYS